MKKSLLTIALATMVFVGFSGIANAATVSVDTSQEESMIAKKLNAITAKKQAWENEQAKKQAASKAKQEKAKKDLEAKQAAYKKQAEANKKAAQARQQQRKNAINSFKNSFKN